MRQRDPAAVPGAPARLWQHLSLARGKHLPRCPRRETGSRRPIPAAFGCLHAWDIKPASPEREELLEGSPKAPGRLPGALGQLPTHLPLPQPSPGQAGGGGERPRSTGQQRQAVTRSWRRAPSSAAARVTHAAWFAWRCACVCARMCVSKSLRLSGF